MRNSRQRAVCLAQPVHGTGRPPLTSCGLLSKTRDGHLHLKLFKEVDIHQLEQLLPNVEVQLAGLDRTILAGTVVVGAASTAYVENAHSPTKTKTKPDWPFSRKLPLHPSAFQTRVRAMRCTVLPYSLKASSRNVNRDTADRYRMSEHYVHDVASTLVVISATAGLIGYRLWSGMRNNRNKYLAEHNEVRVVCVCVLLQPRPLVWTARPSL